ncbi:MAG: hypothetical protein ACI835_003646 [Planctomycetota bacterium]|jgi:hypothetical protein
MRNTNPLIVTTALVGLVLSSICSADDCTGDVGEPVVGSTNDYCNGDKPVITPGFYCGMNVETVGAAYVDEDYFTVVLVPGDVMRVTAYFDDVDGGGNIDIFLYDPVILQNPCVSLLPAVAVGGFSTTCSESFNYWNPSLLSTTEVVIRVNMKLGQNACTNYDLQVEVQGNGQGESYCGSFSENSAGCGAVLHSEAASSGSTDLIVCGLPANQAGIFFFGSSIGNSSLGCGTRCIGGPVTRIIPPSFSTATGTVMRNVTLPAFSRVQFWYRDQAHFLTCGASHNLSNAVRLPY